MHLNKSYLHSTRSNLNRDNLLACNHCSDAKRHTSFFIFIFHTAFHNSKFCRPSANNEHGWRVVERKVLWCFCSFGGGSGPVGRASDEGSESDAVLGDTVVMTQKRNLEVSQANVPTEPSRDCHCAEPCNIRNSFSAQSVVSVFGTVQATIKQWCSFHRGPNGPGTGRFARNSMRTTFRL
jgi:hypothetical protein